MTGKERRALIEKLARHMCREAGDVWHLGKKLWLSQAGLVFDLLAPAIRRAVLEDAANRMADYPRAAPDATQAQHYDEQIEHSQRIVREMMEGDQK